MYLQRLEAHGFKAFADRQLFEYGPGLTVIVGPNGSGKSNVSDAIRWALGESSARQIRARKTEDVIFSGSERRRQMGAAEVTITLDNSEGWMPIEFGEVTVTRRAFRSGDNEYLINGQKVRLADVTDLFRRAQVGQNSYAMMSQGVVDEVLAMRPSERRDLIEEAANVRRHRQQLTLSERRLVETRDNLGRVRMLIREVEPRIRQLQRQTTRAQRYRELAGELQEAQLVFYDHELRTTNEALTAARAAHDQHSQAFRTSQQATQRLERRLAELNAEAAERREALEAAQRDERALAEREMVLGQRIALSQQRLELLAQRRAELEAELADLEALPAAVEDEGALATLDAAVLEARGRVEHEREALRGADEALRAVLRELNETQSRRARLEAELADARRRVEETQQRQLAASTERTQAESTRTRLLGELRELGQRALTLRREGTSYELGHEGARTHRERAEAGLEERLRELIEARDGLRTAEAALRQHEERAAMLAHLAESVTVAGGGAELLLRAAREPAPDSDEGATTLDGVVGAVIGLMRVPGGLDEAITAALAEQLTAVVVEHEDDAVAALDYLREQQGGTATVYPLDRVAHVYPLNLFNERGVVGVAARLVRCDQRYRPLIDTLLGRTIVVEDLATAQEMVQRGLGAVVTRDGTLLRPGGAYFGGRSGAGVEHFSLQRELDELPARREQLDEALGTARGRLGEAEQAVVAARDDVEAARTRADAADEHRRAHAQEAAALRRRQAGLNGEMRLARRALSEGVGDEQAIEDAIGRREAGERALEATDGELVVLRDRSEAVGLERDASAERVTTAVATLATAEGVERAAREQRAERAEAARRAREQLGQRREQLRGVVQESEDLGLAFASDRAALEEHRGALALAQAAVEPAREALGAMLREEHSLQGERTEAQSGLMASERAMLESEAALRQAVAQLQRVQEQMADDGFVTDEHGLVLVAPARASAEAAAADVATAEAEPVGADTAEVQPAPSRSKAPQPSSADQASLFDALATAGPPIRGGAEVDLPALRTRISDLRGEIRALGPVNVEAIEDLSAEQERHDFLGGQVEDLESAERDLRVAIEELRTLIVARFEETFTAVNTAFAAYFERFFGGGVASLKLLDGGEDGETGVEISAQPPGKRIASLNVLSGGERSLTSVALLFALLSVNPAPVCVLDEVDAALDEANVGRFVETLKELTDKSQFIVISHNRRTIEAADAIYGVSMGDDSTSQVLSMRLADLPHAS